jgi:hypothetical protein
MLLVNMATRGCMGPLHSLSCSHIYPPVVGCQQCVHLADDIIWEQSQQMHPVVGDLLQWYLMTDRDGAHTDVYGVEQRLTRHAGQPRAS